MSKQSEAKLSQGYTREGPMCRNCAHFSSQRSTMSNPGYNDWVVESNLRCQLGGFKTLKSSWCKKHESAAQ